MLQRCSGGNELFIPELHLMKGRVYHPCIQSRLDDINKSMVLTPLLMQKVEIHTRKGVSEELN